MNDLNKDISSKVQQAKLRLGIVGNSPALVAAIERAVRVAPIDLSVLVLGESGSGKEFFPQIIHLFGSRKHSKYIAVNCGAIPEGTIDSELFGHQKGAFTGAVETRKGYFEEADGGTIFLDEVGELPLTTQARLLRVLETGEYIKVGSSQVQKTNVRIVAATNVDLKTAIAEGRFREDLYYRLSTVQINVPPLRDRGADIRLLARKFAADFAERYQVPQISFSEEAENLMRHYRWPGNVRQLKNITDQLALFEAGKEIDKDILLHYLPSIADSIMPARIENDAHTYAKERDMLLSMLFNMQRRLDTLEQQVENADNSKVLHHMVEYEQPQQCKSTSLVVIPSRQSEPVVGEAVECEEVHPVTVTLEDNERETIRRALQRNDGHRKAAAAELNISERTLYRKIKEYGLD